MQGLLDFIKTPEGQGLLAGAFGYAANAQRGAPINSIGRGGLAGLLGYSNALERQDQQAENQFQRQYRNMQMDQMRGQLDRQRAQDDWRKNLPTIIGQSQTTYGAGDEGPTINRGNPQALQEYLMRPESPFADKMLERQLFPQEADYKVVGNSLLQVGPNGVTEAWTAPEKINPNQPFIYKDGQIIPNTAYQQFELERSSRSAPRNSTTTINNVDTTGRAFWGDFGKGQADALIQEGQAARTGMGTIKMIDDVVPRLSQAFTGPGAEYRNTAVGALRSIGIDIDEKRFGNTQYIQKQLGEVVLGKIKQLGANPSNADLTFINQTVPRINDDPKALADLLMFMRQKEVERVQGYNAKIEQLRQNPASKGIPYGLDPLSIPEMPKAPSGGATPLPQNPSAANLKRGVVYDTPRGAAQWDGFKFNLVK